MLKPELTPVSEFLPQEGDSQISTQSMLLPEWSTSSPGDDWMLIRYVGHPVGALVPLQEEGLLIGRSREADLVLVDAEISRRHARLERYRAVDQSYRVLIEDLGSTNGTILNGTLLPPRVPTALKDGDVLAVGGHAFKLKHVDPMERRFHEVVLAQATLDPLTGVANRTTVLNALEQQGGVSRRYGRRLSVCLMDLDHFKWINDCYGHAAGDRTLETIGSLLQRRARSCDLVGRIGGEEFLIILPETPGEEAGRMAEDVRQALMLEEVTLPNAHETLHVTCSMGVAEFAEWDLDVGALLARADAALYRAKSLGRNRVEVDTRCPD